MRDRIEEPLSQLCTMLLEIQTDRFDPDAGDILTWHMAKKTATDGAEKKDEGTAVDDSSTESSSNSSSSDSSSDADPH